MFQTPVTIAFKQSAVKNSFSCSIKKKIELNYPFKDSTQASSARLSLDSILSGDVGFARFCYLIAVLGHVQYY